MLKASTAGKPWRAKGASTAYYTSSIRHRTHIYDNNALGGTPPHICAIEDLLITNVYVSFADVSDDKASYAFLFLFAEHIAL